MFVFTGARTCHHVFGAQIVEGLTPKRQRDQALQLGQDNGGGRFDDERFDSRHY